MIITGKNLIALELALIRALDDVKTDHKSDPDYDKDGLEQETKEYRRLLYRVRHGLEKENRK